MRILILLSSLFLISINGFAKNFPYRKLWAEGKTATVSKPWGQTTSQIKQRGLPFGNHQLIPIATLTTTEVRLSSEKINPEKTLLQLRDLIARTYKVNKWATSKRKGYEVFEGISMHSGHYVKLFLRADQNSIKSSLATLEMGYSYHTYLEAELLQREEFESSKGGKRKTAFYLYKELIGPEAMAALSSDDITILLNSWNSVSVPVGALGQDLQGVSASVSGLSGEIGGLSSSLDASSIRVSDSLKGFQDPKTMAKAGAAAGAAFGLASTAAGMLFHGVWDLGVAGAQSLFYEISGLIKPEIQEKMTKESLAALQSLEPLSQKINEFNLRSNTLLLAMAQINGKDPTLVSLENKKRIEDLEKQIKDLENSFHQQTSYESKLECSTNISIAKQNLMMLKEAQKEIDKVALYGTDLCDEYSNIQRNLSQVQLQLKNSRNVLIDSIPILTRKMYDESRSAEQGEKGLFGFSKPSDRKMEGLCPDDEVRELKNRVSDLDNCKCDGTSQNRKCTTLCSSLGSAKEIYSTCIASVETAKSVDPDQQRQERLRLVNQNVKTLKMLQDKLVAGLCSADQEGNACKGKDGEITQVTKALETRVDMAVAACNGKPLPAKTIAAKAKATQAGEKAAQQDTPVSDAPRAELPKSSDEAPSFFGGLYAKIKSAFPFSNK